MEPIEDDIFVAWDMGPVSRLTKEEYLTVEFFKALRDRDKIANNRTVLRDSYELAVSFLAGDYKK